MKIIPAIDLIDGESVRLVQGDYEQKSQMPRTPEEAIKFYEQYEQVKRIHVVDLIGAKEQAARESNLVGELKQMTDIPLEIGGGLRNQETIAIYDELGIDYFILGTRAILEGDWLKEMVEKYPGRIFVGIDAKGENIYVDGWTKDSGRQIDEYMAEIEALDIAGVIYTDIAKDGMEAGPNVERTAQLQKSTKHVVVASGGVRNQTDLDKLAENGIEQEIVGKAANTDAFWEGLQKL